MEVEVIEFYPDERDDTNELLDGTLHVYIPSLDLDVRGCVARKKGDLWHFSLPMRSAIDQESGGLVKYPTVSFADNRKTATLLEQIQIKGREYIEKMISK